MAAVASVETLMYTYKTTGCRNSEDRNVKTLCRERLKTNQLHHQSINPATRSGYSAFGHFSRQYQVYTNLTICRFVSYEIRRNFLLHLKCKASGITFCYWLRPATLNNDTSSKLNAAQTYRIFCAVPSQSDGHETPRAVKWTSGVSSVTPDNNRDNAITTASCYILPTQLLTDQSNIRCYIDTTADGQYRLQAPSVANVHQSSITDNTFSSMLLSETH
jgi:hypothetical protein